MKKAAYILAVYAALSLLSTQARSEAVAFYLVGQYGLYSSGGALCSYLCPLVSATYQATGNITYVSPTRYWCEGTTDGTNSFSCGYGNKIDCTVYGPDYHAVQDGSTTPTCVYQEPEPSCDWGTYVSPLGCEPCSSEAPHSSRNQPSSAVSSSATHCDNGCVYTFDSASPNPLGGLIVDYAQTGMQCVIDSWPPLPIDDPGPYDEEPQPDPEPNPVPESVQPQPLESTTTETTENSISDPVTNETTTTTTTTTTDGTGTGIGEGVTTTVTDDLTGEVISTTVEGGGASDEPLVPMPPIPEFEITEEFTELKLTSDIEAKIGNMETLSNKIESTSVSLFGTIMGWFPFTLISDPLQSISSDVTTPCFTFSNSIISTNYCMDAFDEIFAIIRAIEGMLLIWGFYLLMLATVVKFTTGGT